MKIIELASEIYDKKFKIVTIWKINNDWYYDTNVSLLKMRTKDKYCIKFTIEDIEEIEKDNRNYKEGIIKGIRWLIRYKREQKVKKLNTPSYKNKEKISQIKNDISELINNVDNLSHDDIKEKLNHIFGKLNLKGD